MAMASSSLLEVEDLTIDLFTERESVRPVDGVSYSLTNGETLAVVGESGSGKTVMCLAPLGLMPVGVAIDIQGRISFDGQDIVGTGGSLAQQLCGKAIGVIFQDPMSALNPARKIGRQIAEVSELHLGLTKSQAESQALDLIKLVGISDPEARMAQYPHELSGGLRQRVMIAIAIAAEPRLLIADEPTTALDVTVQAQILALLKNVQTRLGMAMLLITHDMGVVASCASRVEVMYAGRIVEYGPVEKVLIEPQHPYTMGLIDAIPKAEDPIGAPFRGLPGAPPLLSGPSQGCAFAPRCTHAEPACTSLRPTLSEIGDGNAMVACPVVRASHGQGLMP